MTSPQQDPAVTTPQAPRHSGTASTSGSKPPPTTPSKRRPNGWGRALSPRQVKATILLGQTWEDVNGARWVVRQVHRQDGKVLFWNMGYVSFEGLGKRYRLIEGDA